MSIEESEDIIAQWNEEPPIGFVIRAWLGVDNRGAASAPAGVLDEPSAVTPKELTPQEFARMVDAETAFAERYGTGRR